MIEIGHTLGRYRILQKIGEGGMRIVYLARDDMLQRDVAVKVLPMRALVHGSLHKLFRQEALTLSRLNHPNIAAVYDLGTEEGTDFLVMEYVAGGTLTEKLAQGALSEKEVALLGCQIAEALHEAHQQGIVHRDLKPGNIVLTPKGNIKVLDFGLAKLLPSISIVAASTDSVTADHSVKGTLPYMAPEQLLGERVDAICDIYAAGTVLYEMATGQHPFPETQAPRLIEAILHKPPVPPKVLNRNISDGMESVILKALEKDPKRRYQSSKELALELMRITAPLPLAATPGRWLGR